MPIMPRSGFDQRAFSRALDAAGRAVADAAPRALAASGTLLAPQVRAEAPVRTGRTRDSVRSGPARRRGDVIEQDVTVGEGDPRGIVGYVEFGTGRRRANPFFERAATASVGATIGV